MKHLKLMADGSRSMVTSRFQSPGLWSRLSGLGKHPDSASREFLRQAANAAKSFFSPNPVPYNVNPTPYTLHPGCSALKSLVPGFEI